MIDTEITDKKRAARKSSSFCDDQTLLDARCPKRAARGSMREAGAQGNLRCRGSCGAGGSMTLNIYQTERDAERTTGTVTDTGGGFQRRERMEIFDVCDENGLPTGERVERSVAHAKGILHRTAHVWIIRMQDGRCEVLLQKRSAQKDSYPGMYDTSSAGHIQAGKEPLESALRELEEELGIKAREEELSFIGYFRTRYEEEFHGKPFRDNEMISVFVYCQPVEISDLVLQKSEVEEVRFFDIDAVYQEIWAGSDRFCVNPEGMKLLMEYLGRA